ncbi:alpha/beta hydrolase family protein [Mesobacillus selenatarsenatis]|uniref:Alpha/beta superfamily hydrolase n=1 Tax=Mesobacillus selenatarsenatis (strain DSM 18680 / JCM 14380 / FERM P-15431 / SF-1) TaxID=1321606 RepID=A0A0A8X650_MESS1|nr:alpha/beta fold hydrolase [Mesobacillus selenatarsenatis]GAM14517.1 alpha/beta superfamily hydrolase [Mesobacillus selenatarsenatis SF-1]
MQEAVSLLHNNQVMRGMAHIPLINQKEAPAVILLHGFTGSKLEPHRFFLNISRELEALGIASFRFDFLGSGESDGDFKDMTVLNELAEAETILDYVRSHPSIDNEKVIVLGFSMGGLVASLLAGDHPEKIEKLILLAPAGSMADEAKVMVKNSTYIKEECSFDIGGNLIGKDFIEELNTIDVWERAKRFKRDVLLIHGSNDQAVSIEDSMNYQEKCYQEQATLRIVNGADHTFNSYHWEKEVIQNICNFVK